MELYEKKLTSKQIFDGKVVKLFVDTVELPDGSEAIREIVRHPGAVCVIPVTKDMIVSGGTNTVGATTIVVSYDGYQFEKAR